MTKQTYTILTSALLLVLAAVAHAQTVQDTRSSSSKTARRSTTPEEQTVRDVYEKVTRLNRASLKQLTEGDKGNDERIIKFELFNFRLGPIEEILAKPHSELVTGFGGDQIVLGRQVSRHNNEPERVAYGAEWTQGQYASAYEPQWTVGQVFSFYPTDYHDVRQYLSYEVIVSLQGKSRRYKAVALFATPVRGDNSLKPQFWDFVVGMGGVLTNVMNETRPLKEPAVVSPVPEYSLQEQVEAFVVTSEPETSSVIEDTGGGESPGDTSGDNSGEITSTGPDTETVTESTTAAFGTIVRKVTENSAEHTSGQHGQRVGFQGVCSTQSGLQQLCEVEITDTDTYERGSLVSFFIVHSKVTDEKQESSTAPLGTTSSCWAARGIAVNTCFFGSCFVNASLEGGGSSVRMVGGNLWNGQLAHTHNCKLPAPGGGNCTLPPSSGICPPGTIMDGFGSCCPISTRICGLAGASQCINAGGSYDFLTCSCSAGTIIGSPIVIDVDGDGIALTAASGGVDFDLNDSGTRERLSWTRENSDDAWLVLDRNRNGTIDSGAELFGDFTPQPAVQAKNGFLALAEFDKEVNGGNGDGVIDALDSIFASLRLWRDTNHNGTSELAELHQLDSLNVKAFALDFKYSRRVDAFGNEFRYRAKVHNTKEGSVGRWAWDVFLVH